MVDSEKIPWLIQKKSWSMKKKLHGQSRKNSMVYPEKIPQLIQKNFINDETNIHGPSTTYSRSTKKKVHG
jgi:hypothetical protein